jgi:Zn-dependent protease
MQSMITVARLRGIPVRVAPSALIVFGVIAWTLASGYFPHVLPALEPAAAWAYGIGAAVVLLVSVVLHELAHAFVARAHGVSVGGITLHVLGGVSELDDEPPHPRAEALIAVAGPLASFVLAAGAFSAYEATVPGTSTSAFLAYVALANVLLGAFNLVPAFPLDGGRLLRAALWAWNGRLHRATRTASRLGTLLAIALIALGAVRGFAGDAVGGLWLAMIGVFLHRSARTSEQLAAVRGHLERVRVADLMVPGPSNGRPSGPDAVVAPDDSAWVAFLRLSKSGSPRLDVVDEGAVVGAIDRAGIHGALARARPGPGGVPRAA